MVMVLCEHHDQLVLLLLLLLLRVFSVTRGTFECQRHYTSTELEMFWFDLIVSLMMLMRLLP